MPSHRIPWAAAARCPRPGHMRQDSRDLPAPPAHPKECPASTARGGRKQPGIWLFPGNSGSAAAFLPSPRILSCLGRCGRCHIPGRRKHAGQALCFLPSYPNVPARTGQAAERNPAMPPALLSVRLSLPALS